MAKRSKEVVFYSERMERRRNARRYWIPAAVLLAMIVIAVTVALLTRSDRGGSGRGEDLPWAYTWTEEKNGKVTLELERPEGSLWGVAEAGMGVAVSGAQAAESGGQTFLTLSIEKQQPKKNTRVVLSPASAGRASFTLALLDGNEDRLGELSVLAEVRREHGKLGVWLLSAGGIEHQVPVSGGEGTGWLYTASINEYGNLDIAVTDENWVPPEETEPVEETEQTEEDLTEEELAEEELSEEELLALEESGESEESEESDGQAIYFGYTAIEFMLLPLEERQALLDTLSEQERTEMMDSLTGGSESEPAVPGASAEDGEGAGNDEDAVLWQCVSDNEAAAEVLSLIYQGYGVTVCVRPGSAGTANVTVSATNGWTLVLACETDANGSLKITSHGVK